MRWSNHASSSSASSDETIVVMTRQADHDHERRPEAVDRHAGQLVEHQQHDDGVEDDRARGPSVSTEMRHDDERQRRPDHGVDQADDEAGEQGVGGAVDVEAVEHGGEHPQRERRGDDDHDAPGGGSWWPSAGPRGADARVGCGHGPQLRSARAGAGGEQQVASRSEHTQPVGRARGRQLVGEAVHGCVEPGGPAHADGGVGAPVHRHDELRAHQFDGAGRPLGVEVALADGAAPAPDRHERDVDRPERAHRLEQVGVAGEVHAGVPGRAPRSRRRRPATRLCGPRPEGCTAGTVSIVSGPKVVVSPARVSRTWPKPLRRRNAAAPAGTIIATSGSNRRSEGTCRWSRWTCEISTRSGRSSVATSTRWWRRRWARRGVSAGSVSTRTPASSIITLAWPSQRTRAGWSDVMCAA